jgi:hypothetical protein
MPGGCCLGLRLLRSQGRVANFFIRQPWRNATGQAVVAQREPSRNTSAAVAPARRGGFVTSNRTRTRTSTSTSTSTADGTPIWHPGASEGQDGPNPAACLEISIHLTTRLPSSPSDAWMHPSNVCIPDIEICRRRTSRQHFCPDTQLWRYRRGVELTMDKHLRRPNLGN